MFALGARTAGVHSGDYGHPFRFKADTVPVESGQVQEQAVPVVAGGPGNRTAQVPVIYE